MSILEENKDSYRFKSLLKELEEQGMDKDSLEREKSYCNTLLRNIESFTDPYANQKCKDHMEYLQKKVDKGREKSTVGETGDTLLSEDVIIVDELGNPGKEVVDVEKPIVITPFRENVEYCSMCDSVNNAYDNLYKEFRELELRHKEEVDDLTKVIEQKDLIIKELNTKIDKIEEGDLEGKIINLENEKEELIKALEVTLAEAEKAKGLEEELKNSNDRVEQGEIIINKMKQEIDMLSKYSLELKEKYQKEIDNATDVIDMNNDLRQQMQYLESDFNKLNTRGARIGNNLEKGSKVVGKGLVSAFRGIRDVFNKPL